MNKLFLSLFSIFSCMLVAQTNQTGINTDIVDRSAVFEVMNRKGEFKGVLPPRLSSTQIKAITKPATGLMLYNLTQKCFSQNTGTPDAPIWDCVSGGIVNWFYMPSISLDVSETGEHQVDLYNLYVDQFENPAANNPGSPDSVPYFLNREDLDYYVTYISNRDVVDYVKITDQGLLTYDVVGPANKCSFLNVVFSIRTSPKK